MRFSRTDFGRHHQNFNSDFASFQRSLLEYKYPLHITKLSALTCWRRNTATFGLEFWRTQTYSKIFIKSSNILGIRVVSFFHANCHTRYRKNENMLHLPIGKRTAKKLGTPYLMPYPECQRPATGKKASYTFRLQKRKYKIRIVNPRNQRRRSDQCHTFFEFQKAAFIPLCQWGWSKKENSSLIKKLSGCLQSCKHQPICSFTTGITWFYARLR